MDGNGRWAKERGLKRTEGHTMGEASLFDTIEGAIEMGVSTLSAYAFSTENWRRSPDEVRWLMGFNRDVIHRRRDELHAMGVRIRWAGRRPKLWKSVISELEVAEEMSKKNDKITLQFCVNYGGRAEIADAAAALARDVKAGRLNPERITEKTFAKLPVQPGPAGRRPVPAPFGRAAHLELPAVAVRVRRDGVPGRPLARLRPPPPVARLRDLREPRPPLRRSRAEPRGALGGRPGPGVAVEPNRQRSGGAVPNPVAP